VLTERQKQVLKLIVADYVASALPVGSKVMVERHGLPVSSATVRNDMGALEEAGYITRPHTSGGGIPSDLGYRYYVDTLLKESPLPEPQRLAIRQRLQGLGPEFETWCQAATAVVAKLVHNAAVVTVPRAAEAHVRQVQLVALQETMALLVLVLQGAKLKEHRLPLPSVVTQDELTSASNRLNQHLPGHNRFEIAALTVAWSDLEALALQTVLRLLEEEDDLSRQAAYVGGLSQMLSQPEFASSERARDVLEAFEQRESLAGLLSALAESRDLRVVIGDEMPRDSLRQCSLVVATYGRSTEVSGTFGIIGPTRMDYSRALATVHFLRDVLDEILLSAYPGDRN